MKTKNKKQEKFICNGRRFSTQDGLDAYLVAMGMRITNTEKIKGVNVVSVTAQ